MMVIMALVTTFMTGPSIDFINKVFKSKEEATENAIDETKFKILFYFEKIAKGKNLLKLANTLTQNKKETSVVTALHMVNSSDVDLLNDEYEEEVFLPIEEEARKLNQNVITLYKVSTDVTPKLWMWLTKEIMI